jgi:hypothetical protein
VEVYVGVDRQGTTAEALRLLVADADLVTLVHNPSRAQIFHPKVYLFEGNEGGLLFVGSNNLTGGGLWQNVEAGALFELDDRSLGEAVADLSSWIESIPDSNRTVLDPARIDELVAKGYVKTDSDPEPTEQGMKSEPELPPLEGFAPSAVPKLPPATGSDGGQPPTASGTGAGTSSPIQTGGPVVKRWYKKLLRSDAQQVSGATNPTGKLRLSRSGADVDQTTYFRNDFFGVAPWANKAGSQVELVTIPFSVTIGGQSIGTINLLVDHDPDREANQGNVTTVLAWGSVLAKRLREENHFNEFVVIEKLAGGSYVLTITPTEPNSYVI